MRPIGTIGAAVAALLVCVFSSIAGFERSVCGAMEDDGNSTSPAPTEDSVKNNATPDGTAKENSTASAEPKAATETGNRLSRESSLYLLMHAHNPVDWYPWGPEAFEKARSENKPVFLSVGYSSCYWCHVMEREVFTNQKIADYLNEHFVCIKVDREERPDIDDIYMTSLIVYQQATGAGGGGGWPLSMFLTPAGDPIAGATYLPPEDTPEGRTGFLTVATRITDVWTEKQESVSGSAAMLAREVRRLSGPMILADPKELNNNLLQSVVDGIELRFDPVYGGVDYNERRPDGPRFPNVPRLQFLLGMHAANPQPDLIKIVDQSLTAMAKGGIRDHLGGGFHRYSTDRRWNVPHFEKMLYDQAQLLEVYAHAALLTDNALYRQVIDELVVFLEREMTLPGGGFCSALDAETNAIEGESYVWTEAQIRETLNSDDADLFMTAYGFHEPQSFEHGRVLYLPITLAELAAERSTDAAILKARLAAMRDQLLAVRAKRPSPLLDDKVLTEWNALMIQGLATSGQIPGREHDLQLASKAADFLLTHLRDKDGHLLRSWRNETPGPRGYLDDYACLASALRTLHTATNEPRWLAVANELTTLQIEKFYDEGQSTFFFTSHDHEKLFARTSSPYDSVSPSGNSITIRNLLALGDHDAKFRAIAESTLHRFSGAIDAAPVSCAGLGMALQDFLKLKASEKTQANRLADPADRRSMWDAARPEFRSSVGKLGHPIFTIAIDEGEQRKTVAADESKDEPLKHSTFKPVLPDPAKPSPFKQDQESRVKVRIYPYFDKLERGGKCPIAIELTIAEGWHINANPANPDFTIPTEVKITSEQKIKMTNIKYPKHEELEVEGQDQPSHVYGNRVIIYAMLEIAADETADEAELTVEVKIQACNSKTCEPPETKKLVGKRPLANPGDEIKRIHESRFPKDDEKDGDEKEAKGEEKKSE
ncbi:MAG: DUF255 domain-containing protein [Planctomycetota bacterium]|nr:DUF255 domain-containing protein [Planctomycetota bacterium]